MEYKIEVWFETEDAAREYQSVAPGFRGVTFVGDVEEADASEF